MQQKVLTYKIPFFSLLIIAFLFLLHAPAIAAPIHIRILHVNDFHGYAEPYRPYGSLELLGGAAYLADRVEAIRGNKQRPTLLLAAGDMIQGNLWSNMNRGKSVIDLMNMMRFDAMVIGNHELDFGQQVLKERIAEAEFPVLGANVDGLPGLKPYVIKNIGGVRIGILGIVTEQTPYSTHPNNVKGLTFTTPAAACEKFLDEVRRQSDVVIVLSHIGFAEDRLLAGRIKGIDAIIGGHSHTKVDKPTVVGDTVILQAWEHGKSLGVLDLTIEEGKMTAAEGHLEMIKPVTGHADKAVAGLVHRYAAEADGAMKNVFGRTCADLDGEHVRFRETNLGNMIADAVREASRSDISLINAGSIRTSIRKGGVTLKDVYSVLPFDNYALVLKLRGRQIVQTLEHGLGRVEGGGGAFLQIAGMQVTYNRSAPSGSRVKKVTIAGLPLDADKEYLVAVNDFMAAGGDGFVFLKAFSSAHDAVKGQIVRDLVADYIRARGDVCPRVEGRILLLEKDRGLHQ